MQMYFIKWFWVTLSYLGTDSYSSSVFWTHFHWVNWARGSDVERPKNLQWIKEHHWGRISALLSYMLQSYNNRPTKHKSNHQVALYYKVSYKNVQCLHKKKHQPFTLTNNS